MSIAGDRGFDDNGSLHCFQHAKGLLERLRSLGARHPYIGICCIGTHGIFVMGMNNGSIGHGDHVCILLDFVLVIRHQEAALEYGEVEVVVFSLKFVQNSLGKTMGIISKRRCNNRFAHCVGVRCEAASMRVYGRHRIPHLFQATHKEQANWRTRCCD